MVILSCVLVYQSSGALSDILLLAQVGTGESGRTHYRSKLYGSTCCPYDMITDSAVLPELNSGDWLYFKGTFLSVCGTEYVAVH